MSPYSELAGPDRVRINSLFGYSFSAISDTDRIDRLSIFSWMMDLDSWQIYRMETTHQVQLNLCWKYGRSTENPALQNLHQ